MSDQGVCLEDCAITYFSSYLEKGVQLKLIKLDVITKKYKYINKKSEYNPAKDKLKSSRRSE